MPLEPAALRWFVLIARLALGAVFLIAAYNKLPWKQPAVLFAMEVASYQVLTSLWAINLVAYTLPWLELAIGIFLVVGKPLRLASSAATLLLGGFFSLMLWAYSRGLEINCGCGLPGGDRLGPVTLIRDGALLALSLSVVIGAFLLHRRKHAV